MMTWVNPPRRTESTRILTQITMYPTLFTATATVLFARILCSGKYE